MPTQPTNQQGGCTYHASALLRCFNSIMCSWAGGKARVKDRSHGVLRRSSIVVTASEDWSRSHRVICRNGQEDRQGWQWSGYRRQWGSRTEVSVLSPSFQVTSASRCPAVCRARPLWQLQEPKPSLPYPFRTSRAWLTDEWAGVKVPLRVLDVRRSSSLWTMTETVPTQSHCCVSNLQVISLTEAGLKDLGSHGRFLVQNRCGCGRQYKERPSSSTTPFYSISISSLRCFHERHAPTSQSVPS